MIPDLVLGQAVYLHLHIQRISGQLSQAEVYTVLTIILVYIDSHKTVAYYCVNYSLTP